MPNAKSEVFGYEFPRYGDVFEVKLDPVVGAETGKTRPALVVSNNINNQYSSTVTVLPVTGRPAVKDFSFEVTIPANIAGMKIDSRIKANQIRTVDKTRLAGLRGVLPQEYLDKVNKALKVHLNIT